MSRKFTGIMAAASNGVIGDHGAIPWNCPSDRIFFRKMTSGSTIVMGRKTYENLPPKLFAHREAIVFSHNRDFICEHAGVVHSVSEMYNIVDFSKPCFMIGGGEIAKLFLENKLIDVFFLTKIHRKFLGDAFLDLDLMENWKSLEIEKTKSYTRVLLISE